jgi:hypothetical protein
VSVTRVELGNRRCQYGKETQNTTPWFHSCSIRKSRGETQKKKVNDKKGRTDVDSLLSGDGKTLSTEKVRIWVDNSEYL